MKTLWESFLDHYETDLLYMPLAKILEMFWIYCNKGEGESDGFWLSEKEKAA